ncbi:MAG: hypothetical protein ACFB10_11485 [Salibacteraceae bacterium]
MESLFDVWSRCKAPLQRYLIDNLQNEELAQTFQEELLIQSYLYLKKDNDPRYREAFLYRMANVMLEHYRNEKAA